MPMASEDPPPIPAGESDAPLRIGYLIPEFPGQTHTWIWRELTCMRGFGAEVHVFSTRLPRPSDAARHAFADDARRSTFYLVPMGFAGAAGALIWSLLHPWGLLRCLGLALTLPLDRGSRWKSLVPLIVPACRLARELRRRRIRRLHIHSCAHSAVLGMMIRRLVGIPFSLTLNADVGWWGGAMAEKFTDADFTIAITHRLLEEARRTAPTLDGDRILLGRIGVDTRQWSAGEPRRPTPAGRILTVSRLVPSKGQDTLLAAASLLRRGGLAVELRFAGEGPQRAELEKLASEQGLQSSVKFLGSLSEHEIIEQLRWADVFVLASHAEPLGVVYMEAMSMEVPTIGTSSGGVGEIITNEADGLLVPPKDPEALAGAIRRVLEDAALGSRLSAAGRKTIVEKFDSRIGAATLYRRMTGRAPATAEGSGAQH